MPQRGRGHQLGRALRIIKLLRERPRTVAGLARDIGEPTRTVYRDLEQIEAAGVTIYRRYVGKLAYHWIVDF